MRAQRASVSQVKRKLGALAQKKQQQDTAVTLSKAGTNSSPLLHYA